MKEKTVPKLTKRVVENLVVEPRDYIVFDTEVSGFGVRILPSGVKSYLVQYRNGGRTKRMTLGKHGTQTADDARKLAIKRLGEVAHTRERDSLREKLGHLDWFQSQRFDELCERLSYPKDREPPFSTEATMTAFHLKGSNGLCWSSPFYRHLCT